MKKKILAIALAVVLVAVAGYSTLAYFTATDTATNKITADTLTIQINEYAVPPAGGAAVLVTEGAAGAGLTIVADNVVPGDTVSKIPKVKNLENNTPAWISVKVTINVTPAAGKTIDATEWALITLDYNDGAGAGLWTDGGDGWWYYNSVVGANTETSELFTGVSFDKEDMGNNWQGAIITIDLVAEAVQAIHNDLGGATGAAGWPTTRT